CCANFRTSSLCDFSSAILLALISIWFAATTIPTICGSVGACAFAPIANAPSASARTVLVYLIHILHFAPKGPWTKSLVKVEAKSLVRSQSKPLIIGATQKESQLRYLLHEKSSLQRM